MATKRTKSTPVYKGSKQNKSLFFPITISVVVVIMLGIVVTTILSSKSSKTAQDKKETSSSVSITPAIVNGQTGVGALSEYTEQMAGGNDPDEGSIVPEITAKDFDGKDVTIKPGEGPYVLAFLAHWCPHCQKEVPKLVELKKEGKLPENVEFVAVATATSSDKVNYPPSRWLSSEDWPWRSIADTSNNKISGSFGLSGYPYVVYVNGDGTLYKRTSGEVDESLIISYAEAIGTAS